MQINESSNCHIIKTEWPRCHPQLTKFAEINTSHQSIFRQFLLIQLWMPRCQSTFSYLTKSEPHIISFLVRKCETQNQSSRAYIVQNSSLECYLQLQRICKNPLSQPLLFAVVCTQFGITVTTCRSTKCPSCYTAQKSCSTKMTNIHSIFNTKDFCKIT